MIVGKTNAPEVGLWPFTEGPAFGVTRNPWSLDHSPGGSSGGAAAAVAAGLVSAAVGSDGAGSVRIPAAWTHLVGIKPQRGRISTWPDAEAFNGLTVIGPLARTVGDAALLLDVLSGHHAATGIARRRRPSAFVTASGRDPVTMRVGIAFNVPYSGAPAILDPEIQGGGRAHRADPGGPGPRGRAHGSPLRAMPGHEHHAALDDRYPRVGRALSRTALCSIPGSARAPASVACWRR